MAFEIPSHYSQSFTTNTELLLQELMHEFEGTYTLSAYTGESAQVVKQFGDVEFGEKTGRFEDTTFSSVEHKQRWVLPTDYDLALPVEKQDEIRMLNSPLSSYVQAMGAAWNRKKDSVINAALLGTSQTGKNGVTGTVFDTNNTIAVNAVEPGGTPTNSGLTIEKLIQVRQAMKEAKVNLKMETPYVGTTAKQKSDLLRATEVGSADYNQVKALVDGEIDTFMGFKFIEHESLLVDGSSFRRCPVWVKSGIHMGIWDGLTTEIGPRPDKKYLTQVFMAGTMGATRTQEGKVHEILCEEA